MVGRQWVTATGTGSNKSDGTYQLRVTLPSGGSSPTCQVVQESTIGKSPTSTQCWIPIYTISDGKITTDYRGAFVVPCYET